MYGYFWPQLFLYKPGKKCLNIFMEKRPHNFTISGCTSTKSYQPKYCGVCTDERCCIPYKSKTVEVEFQCPNGSSFTWHVMWINACFCNLSCRNPNDIFTDLEQYYETHEIGNWKYLFEILMAWFLLKNNCIFVGLRSFNYFGNT